MKGAHLVSACVLSFIVPALASAQVVPAGLETTAGSSNSGYLTGLSRPTRVQQVYSGAEVTSGNIVGLRLRQDEVMGVHAGTCTWTGATVILSSTSVGPDGLGTDFATNHGADATAVFQGDLTITATDTSSDPRPFEILIPFTVAFPFDSSGGKNLLVDITVPNQETVAPCGGMPILDTEVDASDSVSSAFCWNGSCSPAFDTATSLSTGGMVTLILNEFIFGDGFESNDTSAWTVPVF